jgi:hypothetical protein
VKRYLVLPLILGLSGCLAAPQGTTVEDVALFDAAVMSLGCRLVVEGDYLATELQTGLTREQVVAMLNYKLTLKEAEKRAEGGYTFTGGACAA